MGMVTSMVAALSTFYPDAKDVDDPTARWIQIIRLIAKMPTLAATPTGTTAGCRYVYPENELSYTANFLNMLFRIGTKEYKPSPVLERALDVLFILHADHEQNCSTTAMRVIGSLAGRPVLGARGGHGRLYGPLHGGANEAVLRMLNRIGSVDNIPAFMEGVKKKQERLMGFGHRVYKAYDPRASIIKRTADEVFEVTGRNPLLDIALELEKIALNEDYFVERNLYPNVDFYSGIIYQAMGFPVEMFPVLFAIPRTVGWLAQWEEMIMDGEQKIARPRQIYVGEEARDFVPIADRLRGDPWRPHAHPASSTRPATSTRTGAPEDAQGPTAPVRSASHERILRAGTGGARRRGPVARPPAGPGPGRGRSSDATSTMPTPVP
jgi:citrate synthase